MPERFSRAISPILSSFFCIAEKIGTLRVMTRYSVSAISSAAPKKMSDSLRFIVIAITSEPAIINGARVSRRIIMAMLCCT